MTLEQDAQLAALAVETISKIIDAVRSAKSGKLDPDVALAQISSLHDALAANNAAADKLLEQKFDVP